MIGFLVRRAVSSAVTLFLILTIVFFLFHLLPGDPTIAVLSPLLPAEAHDTLMRIFGLDKPLYQQYFIYLVNIFHGQFGRSFRRGMAVTQIIGERLLNTLFLALSTFTLTYSLAIPLALVMVWNRGTWIESTLTGICLALRAPPLYWTGMLLMILFSFTLRWLPYAGIRTPGYMATGIVEKYLNLDFLRHLVLPTLVMTAYFLSFPLLLLRNAMERHLQSDYVRSARAKGLRESAVLLKHVLRNAMLPVVTSAALYIGLAVGGLAIVEYVFSYPGLGRTIIGAIQNRDYAVAQGAFILIGATVVVMNLVADLLYGLLDPRITYD